MTPPKPNPQPAGRKRLYPGEKLHRTSIQLRRQDEVKARLIGGNVSTGVRMALDAYLLPDVLTVAPPADGEGVRDE